MIPIFRCTDMQKAVSFYTKVLDFKLYPTDSEKDVVVTLINGDAALMLTTLEEDQKIGIAANVLVTGIDELFKKYLGRGLDTTHKPDSPVHQSPIDQTWGSREFYVTDPDGNTLRFVQW